MTPRHDHVLEAISAVLSAVELKDAPGAQTATAEMLRRVHQTPSLLADDRVQPLFEQAWRKVEAFHHELELELRSTAVGARASRAYLPPTLERL